MPFETQENLCLFGTWLDLPVFQVFTFGLNGCVRSFQNRGSALMFGGVGDVLLLDSIHISGK